MEDLTGSRNVFATLGARNYASNVRDINDYYATDPIAIDLLIDTGIEIDKKIWEPACGEGHLSKRLKEYGYDVYSTDLVDRGYCDDILDFLKTDKKWDGDIVTNPPYKYALEFVQKSLDVVDEGHRVIMFLKLLFLESTARRKLFDTKQLEVLYVSSKRITCAQNGMFDKFSSGAIAYGWFVFKKGYNSDPIIKWIN